MARTIYRIVNMFFFPTGSWGFFIAISVLALMVLCTNIVIWTGGTQNSYVHCIYFPIIAAGSSFGIIGGLVSGIAATLLMGPFMPSSFEPLVWQSADTWLFRGSFFTGVGLLTGMSASIFRAFLTNQKKRLLCDSVTNLLNLRGLKHYLDESDIIRPANMSIFIMEIKRLQDIEKALGPDGLQKFLRQIADKIAVIADECLYIGHLETGGFFFVTDNKPMSLAVIAKCQQLLCHNFIVDNIPLFVEIYFGLAVAVSADEPVTSIMRKAKIAAIKAHKSNQIQGIFDDVDDAASRRSVQIIHDLNQAIINNNLVLHYQPKIDLATQQMMGVEVLVRWTHPQFGIIAPDEFIPLVEKTLLINSFTKWLLDNALAQYADWRNRGAEFSLAVNFSMANFQDISVLDHLYARLKHHNIPHQSIEIEVTETAVADDIDTVIIILKSLRDHGLRIAIDDFGTGQSSLQYLCELPIDTIKIDKVFVNAMISNSAAESIVRSSILLSQELKLTVVAEGIETEQQASILSKMGCDIGQGYYYAKPLASELIDEMVIKMSHAKKTTTSQLNAGKNSHQR